MPHTVILILSLSKDASAEESTLSHKQSCRYNSNGMDSPV